MHFLGGSFFFSFFLLSFALGLFFVSFAPKHDDCEKFSEVPVAPQQLVLPKSSAVALSLPNGSTLSAQFL